MPVVPTIGKNAFEQALPISGIKPIELPLIDDFKQKAQLATCPGALMRFLMKKHPTRHAAFTVLLFLAMTAMLFASMVHMAFLSGPELKAANICWLFALCAVYLAVFSSFMLRFPVWTTVRLREYEEPIPLPIREFVEQINRQVKGVDWSVEKLTMSRDPLLRADYGRERYYLKQWEETPPQND